MLLSFHIIHHIMFLHCIICGKMTDRIVQVQNQCTRRGPGARVRICPGVRCQFRRCMQHPEQCYMKERGASMKYKYIVLAVYLIKNIYLMLFLLLCNFTLPSKAMPWSICINILTPWFCFSSCSYIFHRLCSCSANCLSDPRPRKCPNIPGHCTQLQSL